MGLEHETSFDGFLTPKSDLAATTTAYRVYTAPDIARTVPRETHRKPLTRGCRNMCGDGQMGRDVAYRLCARATLATRDARRKRSAGITCDYIT